MQEIFFFLFFACDTQEPSICILLNHLITNDSFKATAGFQNFECWAAFGLTLFITGQVVGL